MRKYSFQLINKAFTLAEVLITLAVIGVVAAMTIPTLIGAYKKTVSRSNVKKAYSILSEATNLIKMESGNTLVNAFGSGVTIPDASSASDNLALKFKDKLKVAKYCAFIDRAQCFGDAETGTWMLAGTTAYDLSLSPNGAGSVLVLSDGSLINFDLNSSDCSYNGSGLLSINSCAYIFVDANGRNSPNKVGIDIFSFYLTRDALIPMGDTNVASSCYCLAGEFRGWGCTQYVLDGKDWE